MADNFYFFALKIELNVSNNRMSKLPEEIGEMQHLAVLNISHNAFVSLPRVTYTLPKLEEINAEKNYISGKYVPKLIHIQISYNRGYSPDHRKLRLEINVWKCVSCLSSAKVEIGNYLIKTRFTLFQMLMPNCWLSATASRLPISVKTH